MVREDILAGLKNGLERGASIEQAKNSLLGAGYSPEEVQEAVDSLSADSVMSMQEQPSFKSPADSIQPSKPKANHQVRPSVQQNVRQPVQQPIASSNNESEQESQGFFAENWKIIVLVAVLILLIAIFVLVLLFSDTIASWFS